MRRWERITKAGQRPWAKEGLGLTRTKHLPRWSSWYKEVRNNSTQVSDPGSVWCIVRPSPIQPTLLRSSRNTCMSALPSKRLFGSTSFVATLKVLDEGSYTWRHDQGLTVADAICMGIQPSKHQPFTALHRPSVGNASSETQLEDKPGVWSTPVHHQWCVLAAPSRCLHEVICTSYLICELFNLVF